MTLVSHTVLSATTLPGYTQGAEVINVDKTRGQIDAINGIVYSQIIQTRTVRALHMSLLLPRNHSLKPAIVYFPGGGFTSADYDKFIEMRMALAEAGYVVATAEYRVIPDTFPAPVIDGKSAIRYLRQHASEYGIDPSRIGVLGDSAGGWMAQMLGTTGSEKAFDKGDFLNQSSSVQAVVSLYGISNLLNIGEGFPAATDKVHQSPAATEALLVNGAAFRDFAGASITHDPKKALYASPVGHLDGKKPPFLLMHGSADTLVSPLQSAQLYQALNKAGDPVEYVLIEGAEHGDIHWYQKPVIDRVVNWFTAKLGQPVAQENSRAGSASANL
ncbi:alpha/beta hydrolase fold domain-containing protein [Rahnella sp. PCH160]|uniref:alpha/beta hydrolase fold domain-containing protein n=1 Tax=Rahnella sp. PCH160 TaxID=3447928 RepID=UPI0039FCB370